MSPLQIQWNRRNYKGCGKKRVARIKKEIKKEIKEELQEFKKEFNCTLGIINEELIRIKVTKKYGNDYSSNVNINNE